MIRETGKNEIESCIRDGRILILPFARTDKIYHCFRRKMRSGKIVWTFRKIPYEWMAYLISRDGNDGMFSNDFYEAKRICQSCAAQFGGSYNEKRSSYKQIKLEL